MTNVWVKCKSLKFKIETCTFPKSKQSWSHSRKHGFSGLQRIQTISIRSLQSFPNLNVRNKRAFFPESRATKNLCMTNFKFPIPFCLITNRIYCPQNSKKTTGKNAKTVKLILPNSKQYQI